MPGVVAALNGHVVHKGGDDGCDARVGFDTSDVMMRCPFTCAIIVMQAWTALSSSSTVQVPHSPSPQPRFVPVRCRSSRSTSTAGALARRSQRFLSRSNKSEFPSERRLLAFFLHGADDFLRRQRQGGQIGLQCVIDGGKQRRRDRHKAGFADGLGAVGPPRAAVFDKPVSMCGSRTRVPRDSAAGWR